MRSVSTKRVRHYLLSQVPQAYAEALRDGEQDLTFTVTVGNVDLPAFVSSGILYVQAPLPKLFEAFAEDLSDFLRDMEVGISDSRGTSFSLDRNGRPVHREKLAQSGVVRSGGKRR